MKFLNLLLTQVWYKRAWNERYYCERSFLFQGKYLDEYNWTTLLHLGQFFLISMVQKLPYVGLIKSVHVCISPNTDIYKPNTDIFRLYRDLYMSVFALCDKENTSLGWKNVDILDCLFFEPEHNLQMLTAFRWSSLYPLWLSLTDVEQSGLLQTASWHLTQL